MKAAACSCRVRTSSTFERRRDSTMSRFSSPGMPKTRSTPSLMRAATIRSDPLLMRTSDPNVAHRSACGQMLDEAPRMGGEGVEPAHDDEQAALGPGILELDEGERAVAAPPSRRGFRNHRDAGAERDHAAGGVQS